MVRLEFVATVADLARELGMVRGAADKKTAVPILGNVLLEAARDSDRVTLTATDLEIGLRCSCAASVSQAGAATAPARKLFDFLKLLPDGDVHVKFTEANWLCLESGRNRTKIAGMPVESFPALPATPDVEEVLPAGAFAAAAARVAFAISKEESRFTLNGALLSRYADGTVLVATDGHRLAMVRTGRCEGEKIAADCVIPARALEELVKLAAGAEAGTMLHFAGDQNHLFFRVGARALVAQKISGAFPDWRKVLPERTPTPARFDREGLLEALSRVMQFASDARVACRFGTDELRVFGQSLEAGESEEFVPCSYAGAAMELGFNGQYLRDFLGTVSYDQVLFEVRDEKGAGELRPTDEAGANGEYRYVVMPMRA